MSSRDRFSEYPQHTVASSEEARLFFRFATQEAAASQTRSLIEKQVGNLVTWLQAALDEGFFLLPSNDEMQSAGQRVEVLSNGAMFAALGAMMGSWLNDRGGNDTVLERFGVETITTENFNGLLPNYGFSESRASYRPYAPDGMEQVLDAILEDLAESEQRSCNPKILNYARKTLLACAIALDHVKLAEKLMRIASIKEDPYIDRALLREPVTLAIHRDILLHPGTLAMHHGANQCVQLILDSGWQLMSHAAKIKAGPLVDDSHLPMSAALKQSLIRLQPSTLEIIYPEMEKAGLTDYDRDNLASFCADLQEFCASTEDWETKILRIGLHRANPAALMNLASANACPTLMQRLQDDGFRWDQDLKKAGHPFISAADNVGATFDSDATTQALHWMLDQIEEQGESAKDCLFNFVGSTGVTFSKAVVVNDVNDMLPRLLDMGFYPTSRPQPEQPSALEWARQSKNAVAESIFLAYQARLAAQDALRSLESSPAP